ncbi:MAG: hypothetical protein IKU66_05340 [Clostridia bacterium]|nr:hypothetical protein [Clostridia bacterium]
MQNDMRDRLVELIMTADGCDCENTDDCYNDCNVCLCEKLADHLIANGVIVPPCKVGETVYWVTNYITDRRVLDLCIAYNEETDCGIVKLTVDGFYYNYTKGLCLTVEEIPYYNVFFLRENTIGKSVFFDIDQAEQKLKEMRVDNG